MLFPSENGLLHQVSQVLQAGKGLCCYYSHLGHDVRPNCYTI